ncbi:glycoside hydrolase family 131 protein [Plenodomus tracheiphilus IPT5]|uniref:Glycoside hydrolase family 131 protein n=1 Tax=Plenodomus tracheiphilus IPT5 TaxID=1408161 RepID=A0A6A7AUM5_9PLEO|nr:glycoside hydrolase family 131 protein [Plenodomus tracheiphilus IPT5]
MFSKVTLLSALIGAVSAGTTIWDGRFNDMTSSADLEKWSFSNPVGAYQYYIHGSGAVDKYVNLDAKFKNPADTGSKQGVKITIDETSKWNGQTMLRTELIPQTTAAINKGKVYYHFSIKTSADNVPTATNEHQIAFFESHFTELKYGTSGSSNTKLQWHVGGVSKWDVELVADEWHNVAYEIDFDAGSVTFWHSTGSAALTKTAGPFGASTQSNGADWHLGVLRLPGSNDAPGAEDWFFSGVYVESGDLTTSVNTAGGAAEAEEPAASSVAVVASSTKAAAPAVETPVAASSSAVAVASSTAVAPVETPAASSSAAAVETPVASPTPVVAPTPVASSTAAATPTASTGAGAGSDAVLPEEFTIKQFVAWLRAKQAAL